MEHIARNLLLVDDDPDCLALLAEALLRAGYDVTAAPDPHTALACARRTSFSLALLDMRMPQMTGAVLARRLRNEVGCFSLIISGAGDPASMAQAIRGGALGYLVKPVPLAELVPAIEAALARAGELG
jgi:DNA-binding response OmpR family regulator